MPCYKCVVCKLTAVTVKQKNLPISFHNFPSDPDRKLAWEEFCGTPSGVVCSEHFSDDCFLGGREEKNKRRRLVTRAVPTIRFPETNYASSTLPTNYFEESFDFMEEGDISEADSFSAQHGVISDLKDQIEEYKTQLDDTTKKLHEMEVAIFERDCIIDELRKKLDDAALKLNP